MMNLAEYRRSDHPPCRLPALGRAGRRGHRPQQGRHRSSAPRGFAVPISIRAVPAELVGVAGRLNNAFRRLGSGWAIFVEAQRHRRSDLSAEQFPDAASALVDAERKAALRGRGRAFRVRAIS